MEISFNLDYQSVSIDAISKLKLLPSSRNLKFILERQAGAWSTDLSCYSVDSSRILISVATVDIESLNTNHQTNNAKVWKANG
jgi:hypothetical protein